MPFDDRIVKVVFTIGDQTETLDSSTGDPKKPPLIVASGVKYADATQNECTLMVGGLSRELRNALATNLTPFDYNQKRKSFQVWAGRASTGMFLRYEGDIISAVPSQPPNITMTIRSKTAQFFKQDVLAQSYAVAQVPMSQIAGDVAKSMGLNLQFEATDRNIQNYSYNGSSAKQVDKLNALGGMDAFVDDGKLICKNKGEALKNISHTLSAASGMIGQPELTEYGVRVKCMLSPNIQIGATLTLDSINNPSLNGDYTIYRTGFEITTRDISFYDVIEATRYPAMFFTATLPT